MHLFPASCDDNEFLCDNGKCILAVFKCDLNGDDDCGDNSDERGCGSMFNTSSCMMIRMEIHHLFTTAVSYMKNIFSLKLQHYI